LGAGVLKITKNDVFVHAFLKLVGLTLCDDIKSECDIPFLNSNFMARHKHETLRGSADFVRYPGYAFAVTLSPKSWRGMQQALKVV